jgi:hypothetical protein
MALVTLGSVSGAPGVTTLGVALTRSWPGATGGRAVLVEADPDGGALAARAGVPSFGLRELAAQARTRFPGSVLEANVTDLTGPTPAILAPADPALSSCAAQGLAPIAYGLREIPGTTVLADVGRYRADSPATCITEAADLRVVVLRGEIAEMETAAALGHLPGDGRTAAVLVGADDGLAARVARRLGLRVLGTVPHDPKGATMVFAARSRSKLLNGALLLAAVVNAQVPRP